MQSYALLDSVLSIDDLEDAREWAIVYSDRQAAASKDRMEDLKDEEVDRLREAERVKTEAERLLREGY